MFPTLLASGLVLFGFAELLFLGHISIFTKDFYCSLVTRSAFLEKYHSYLLSLSLSLLFLYVAKK